MLWRFFRILILVIAGLAFLFLLYPENVEMFEVYKTRLKELRFGNRQTENRQKYFKDAEERTSKAAQEAEERASKAADNVSSGRYESQPNHRNAIPSANPNKELGTIDPKTVVSKDATYVSLVNAGWTTIIDSKGHTNSTFGNFVNQLEGVTVYGNGSGATFIILDDEQYTLSFKSSGEPINVDVRRGKQEEPKERFVYNDLNIPRLATILLRAHGETIGELSWGFIGGPDSLKSITPTSHTVGPSAKLLEPPRVKVEVSQSQQLRLITIVVFPVGSPLKSIRYSLDGTVYKPYAGPFMVDPKISPVIYTIADDENGNRSAPSFPIK